jgi:hypothetical protein
MENPPTQISRTCSDCRMSSQAIGFPTSHSRRASSALANPCRQITVLPGQPEHNHPGSRLLAGNSGVATQESFVVPNDKTGEGMSCFPFCLCFSAVSLAVGQSQPLNRGVGSYATRVPSFDFSEPVTPALGATLSVTRRRTCNRVEDANDRWRARTEAERLGMWIQSLEPARSGEKGKGVAAKVLR